MTYKCHKVDCFCFSRDPSRDLNIIKKLQDIHYSTNKKLVEDFFWKHEILKLHYNIDIQTCSYFIYFRISWRSISAVSMFCTMYNNVHKNQQGGNGSETGFFPSWTNEMFFQLAEDGSETDEVTFFQQQFRMHNSQFLRFCNFRTLNSTTQKPMYITNFF